MAVTVKVFSTTLDGVPDSAPSGERDSPFGSAPGSTLNSYDPLPPLAVIVVGPYGTHTFPAASVAGASVIGLQQSETSLPLSVTTPVSASARPERLAPLCRVMS